METKIKKLFSNQESRLFLVERGKQEWEAVVDSLPDAVFLVDKIGRVLRSNKVFEQWNSDNIEDIRGKKIHALLHPGCKDKNCYLNKFWQKAIFKLQKDLPVKFKSKDKILSRYFVFDVICIQKQKIKKLAEDSFAVVIIKDITEYKKVEERLIESYKYLGMMNRGIDIITKLRKKNQYKRGREKLNLTLMAAKEISQAEEVHLFQYHNNDKIFSLMAAECEKKGGIQIRQLSRKISATWKAYIKSKAKIFSGSLHDCYFNHIRTKDEFGYFVALPLLNGKKLMGILLFFFSKKREITTENMFFYEIFSMQLNIFILDLLVKSHKKTKQTR